MDMHEIMTKGITCGTVHEMTSVHAQISEVVVDDISHGIKVSERVASLPEHEISSNQRDTAMSVMREPRT